MISRRLRVRCAAKINLYLDVLGKRPDGFHDIETLYQPVTLYDEVVLQALPQGIELAGSDSSLPWDRNNLCWRAAEAVLAASGARGGVGINVTKRIPAGAGLGGGSSDAAGVLAGVDMLLGLGLGRARLMQVALRLGSDVPFFLFGSPAVGRGRGEILSPAGGAPGGWIVIGKPQRAVSTAWAYGKLNLMLTRPRGGNKLAALTEALEVFPDRALETHNSFQAAVIESYPEIGDLLGLMRRGGALLSALSGSGSSCFALYDGSGAAFRVRERLMESGYFAWVVRPVRQAMILIEKD